MDGLNTNMSQFSDLVENIAAVLRKKESEGTGGYNALNDDSGARGAYQIMPENWGGWAREAGLDPSSQWTPENQDLVAKTKISNYLKQFGGDPSKVFISWYGGPGWADTPLDSLDGSEGDYPSIKSYVLDGMRRLGVDTYDARTPQYEEMKIPQPAIVPEYNFSPAQKDVTAYNNPGLETWFKSMMSVGGM
jgi:hypothetical protein